CEEIVFSPAGKLGRVVSDSDAGLDKDERDYYLAVRRNRPGYSEAVVRKMFDRSVVLVRSPKAGGEAFVDAARLPEVPARNPILGPGTIALYNFAQAAQLGLCQPAPQESREQLAEAYGLPRSALHDNPLLGKVTAWQIEVEGEINGAMNERL